MRLLENIHLQRIEFLRRNISAPDLLLVPYRQKHQLLGELVDKYQPVNLSVMNLHVMEMLVIFTDSIPSAAVALSAECLRTGEKR